MIILNGLMFILIPTNLVEVDTETTLIQNMISRLLITQEKRTTMSQKAKIALVT
jgi:hypothetical protein